MQQTHSTAAPGFLPARSGNTVSIAGTDVQQITYKGDPVVTFAMVEDVHQRPTGTAGRNFRENRARFVEGEDFINVNQPDEIRRLGFERPQGGTPPFVTLLTRRGYLKLTKTLNDDRAWQVQGDMVDRYFAVEAAKLPRLPTTAEAFASVFSMVADQEARQEQQDKQIKAIGAKVDQVAQAHVILDKLPSDCEYITVIRKRMNKQYGLSETVVDTVMRNSPYAPTTRALVKNQHVEAAGAHNQGFSKKEVSAVFRRFVDECQMVSVTMATHPFVEGQRFKLTGKAGA